MINQVVRFEPVLRLLRELGGGAILDVGSGSVGLTPWLGPEWTVTAVDSSFDDYGSAPGPARDRATRVLGDATALPFADDSFDVAVALDLLEHLPPGAPRTAAMRELCRVARRCAIVACPAGEAALAADRGLAEAVRRRGQPAAGWLDEHLEHGFPDPEDLRTALAPFGPVEMLGNENARVHELLMRAEARRPGFHASRRASRALRGVWHAGPPGRAVVRGLAWAAAGGHRPPTYRVIAVVRLEDGPPAQAAGAGRSSPRSA